MSKLTEKQKHDKLPPVKDNYIYLYTDGSCIASKGGLGGYGVYISNTDEEFLNGFKSGLFNGTTTSVMEMKAMLYALKYILNIGESSTYDGITIISDSEFVVKSINLGWLDRWSTESFVDRANSEIWKEIYDTISAIKEKKIEYSIEHIYSHQKDLSHIHIYGNHVADNLADYKQYKSPTKVIIAGGRMFNDYNSLKTNCNNILKQYSNIEIVSGAANGADQLGEKYARKRKYLIKRFPAEWDKYGKLAGRKRNKQMADYADVLIAFWDNKTKGTKHMIETARKNGLDVYVVSY